MLDPDNWGPGFAGLDDQSVDIGNDFIPAPSTADNICLYIYNE